MQNEKLPTGGYGWAGMSPKKFSDNIKQAAKKIAAMYRKDKFDAVAFTGSSGAAIAFYLATEYEIPLLYVRKTGEKSHGQKVESNSPSVIRKYLIVDDFISSGTTVRSIIRKISKQCTKYGIKELEPIGVFCYDSQWKETVKISSKLTLPVFD